MAKSRLLPTTPLVLDSISQKAFVLDRADFEQGAVDAGGQEFVAEACQRRRSSSAEHVRRNCEIELIDHVLFQQGSKKRGSTFARERAHVVLITQCFQHHDK